MIDDALVTNIYVRNNKGSVIDLVSSPNAIVLDLFSTIDSSTIKARFDRLVEVVGYPSQSAIDFLLFAVAVYVADKTVQRKITPDKWTRTLNMMCPVEDKSLWSSAETNLTAAISFLTGDRWKFDWSTNKNNLWYVNKIGQEKYQAVCLLSGGLDSLIGAIDLLEDKRNKRILFIGHYDSNLTPKIQQLLFERLVSHYGSERLDFVQILVRPAEKLPAQQYPLPRGRERTTRSRSLVFISLGIAAACASGSNIPLYIPENGFIALNIPLTSARLGSCSTRTTHPYFSERLQAFLQEIGITNPIINPYQYHSKGQMLERCLNQPLLRELAHETVSCARPEASRFQGKKYGNCGYCFPCLIRRSSLHVVGLDKADDYKVDVCNNEAFLNDHRVNAPSRDTRAVFKALYTAIHQNKVRSFERLPIIAGPIKDLTNLQMHSQVHQEGLLELRNFFLDKASVAVKRIASIE